jgi:hypothetical protein
MVRRTLLGLALLGVCASLALGQAQITNVFDSYDLDVNTFVYCDPADIGQGITACATGAAATDGWIDVRNHGDKSVGVVLNEVAVTGGIIVTFEVRYQMEGGEFTDTITLMTLIAKDTALTDNQSVRIPDEVTQLRVGIRIGTADDGGDAVEEDIDIVYNAR